MRKTIFTIIFMLSFAAVGLAQSNTANTQNIPADFVSDGCSMFPDCDYRDCCEAHDLAYYFGGTSKERWQADRKLYKCVAAKKGFHHKIIAPIMWLGVRTFGVSWLPTPFRWGFGQEKKPKVKRELPSE